MEDHEAEKLDRIRMNLDDYLQIDLFSMPDELEDFYKIEF